jgi:FixJ family two-component response regulator
MASDDKDPLVFVLDDDRDLLDSMVAIVEGFCKKSCITATSVREMVELSAQVLRAELVFLDINLGSGNPSGVEGYRWLRKQKYPGRVIFFTGHAHSHPQVQEALRLGDADVVQKPVPVGALMKLIEA